jgi:hypothetical protein
MIEAGGPSTGEVCYSYEFARVVRAPPRVGIFSPLTIQRNAERAQKRRATRREERKRAAQGSIKAGTRKPR